MNAAFMAATGAALALSRLAAGGNPVGDPLLDLLLDPTNRAPADGHRGRKGAGLHAGINVGSVAASFRLDSDGAEDSRMAAGPRRVASLPRQGRGPPHTWRDLGQHAIVLGPASLGGHWSFRKGDTATSLQVEGKLTITASLGAIAAAVEGLGIVMTPLGVCRRELDRGELVRLLPEWDVGTVELNAVYPSGSSASRG